MGATVVDDAAISTVVPPSWTKDKGAYIGVPVAFKGKCVGAFVDVAGQHGDKDDNVKSVLG